MNKVAINGNNILSRFKLITKYGVIKPFNINLKFSTVRDGVSSLKVSMSGFSIDKKEMFKLFYPKKKSN